MSTMATTPSDTELWRAISARGVTSVGRPGDVDLYRRLITHWTAPEWTDESADWHPDAPRDRYRAETALRQHIAAAEAWSQGRIAEHQAAFADLNLARYRHTQAPLIDARAREVTSATVRLVRELEEAIAVGLGLRRDLFLVPIAVPAVEMMQPWAFFSALHATLAVLANQPASPFGRQPGGHHVCEGCTLIFRPRLKASAVRCRLCAKRKPPMEFASQPTGVQPVARSADSLTSCEEVAARMHRESLPMLGGVLGLSPAAAPGDRVVVRRLPEMTEGGFMVGSGWHTFAYATCAHCSREIPAGNGRAYCNAACKQAAYRERLRAR